jgi:hypothetical protein
MRQAVARARPAQGGQQTLNKENDDERFFGPSPCERGLIGPGDRARYAKKTLDGGNWRTSGNAGVGQGCLLKNHNFWLNFSFLVCPGK